MINAKNNILSSQKENHPFSTISSLRSSYSLEKYRTLNKWSLNYPYNIYSTSLAINKPNEQKLKNKCWELLTNLIILNYNFNKGTRIDNFGTFTFINFKNVKTNNFNSQEISFNNVPIFLVSEQFMKNIKPGIFEDKNGLVELKDKKYSVNNNIQIFDVSYEKLGKLINISEEKFKTNIFGIINDIRNQIEQQIFYMKKMDGLGIFLRRGNAFGMRFDNKSIYLKDVYNNCNYFPTKIKLKKSFNLNKIRNRYAITDSNSNKEDENNYNYNFSLKSNIIEDNLRNFKLLKLKNLNLKDKVIENFINNKESLIKKIKNENENQDFISKEAFINYITDLKLLDYDTINKIINIYEKESNNNIDFVKLINSFCNDINKITPKKKLVNIEKDKSKYNAPLSLEYKNNVRNKTITDNMSEDEKTKYPDIKRSNINEDEALKIKKVISSYIDNNQIYNLRYEDLLKLLNENDITTHKNNLESLFELKITKDEQLMDLTDCILKINKKFRKEISKNISKSLNRKNLDEVKDRLYITNYCTNISNKNAQRNQLNRLTSNNYYISSYSKNKYNPAITNMSISEEKTNINDEEIVIKSINLLKARIFKDGNKQEKISNYFDHMLLYVKIRKENIINLDEFKDFLKNEDFNFSEDQAIKLFNYIDCSHKGHIDRLDFINAIKVVPYPITNILNYFKRNKLSIFDISYKMQIDIYNIPFEILSNINFNFITFFSRMKSIDNKFDKYYLSSVYIALCGNINNVLPYKKMFEIFNVYNRSKYTYLNIYENKENINNNCNNLICNNITYFDLKKKLFEVDPKITGILNYNEFYKAINNAIKGKLDEQNFLHYLRINKLIEINDEINYLHFLRFIDTKYPDDSFIKCIKHLAELLDQDCERDLFLFTVKINNMNNNSTSNEVVDPEKLFYIFKNKNEFVKYDSIQKFDYNEDGIISINDLKNTILKYYDIHFFDNKKILEENKIKEETDKFYQRMLKVYNYIIEILKKNNLTNDDFFIYLDKNKDEYIDKEEFFEQILSLPYFDNNYDQKELEAFFDYLDEFKNNKVNIDSFTNKLRLLHDKNAKNNIFEKRGEFILEDLILNKLYFWYTLNKDIYTEEEIFSMMDKDNDGIISCDDLKSFLLRIFNASPNELNDSKITNLIHVISLNKENSNISLVDFQNLIDSFNRNDIHKYKENIFVNYIKDNNNNKWIKYIINELKIHLNKIYGNNIDKLYNEYNVHFYQNKGQGLSYDNFDSFILKNFGFFENYHLDKSEMVMLFNYISNNKKFITLNDLKTHFTYNNNKDNDDFNYNNEDFYENMHKIIKKFLNDNFPLSNDAFLFFKNIKNKYENRDYITIKEFYDGINSLFPKKYETETILNYYRKIFKNNIINETKSNQLKIIKYDEFKKVYYKKYIEAIENLQKNYDEFNLQNLFNKRSLISHSVDNKLINYKTATIDPFEKMRRILKYSGKDKSKNIIDNYINRTKYGSVNKYQLYNLIKRLKLGLTNNEIEEIISKEGFVVDGSIDLFKFKELVFREDYNLDYNQKIIDEKLSEIKQLIIKYYSSPLLAFELNIKDRKNHFLNFEDFKELMYQIYMKDNKNIPSFPLLKSLFDYIDYKKNGFIIVEEWNQIFSKIKGSLDMDNDANPIKFNKNNFLKEWENSGDIIKIFKLISKNRKLIKEKYKLFSLTPNCLLIHSNDLIKILKEVLFDVNLNNEQWKLIVSIGKKGKSEFIDFKTFTTIIEFASKII